MTDKYQLFDPLTDDEYAALKADIAARGVMVPVEVDEDGNILDGHHRVMACEELGIAEYPTVVREGMTEAEKRHHVRQLNFARRHLTKEQRDRQILAMRREGGSYQAIAEAVGVSKRDIRQTLLEGSTNGTTLPDTITGTDGKTYPATRSNGSSRATREVAAYEAEYNRPVYDEDEGEDTSWLDDEHEAKESKPHVAHNSGENEWYTPSAYIEAARLAMGGIDLDPATSDLANETVQASTYFTILDDGLTKRWFGRVWMNPPYSQPEINHFAQKVVESVGAGDVQQACVLVNNATETGWFQALLSEASAVCLPKSRIRFVGPDGQKGAPLQGQAILYFGQRTAEFAAVFSEFGCVLEPHHELR